MELFVDDELVTQRTLAADLGVAEETLSRTLRRAREQGMALPRRCDDPGTGYGHWYRRSFHKWWREERPARPPGRPPAVTEQQLRQGVKDGWDVQQIALRWNVPVRAVRRAARRAGIVVAESRDRRVALVRQLAGEGIEPQKIVELTGYPETSVYRYLREIRDQSTPGALSGGGGVSESAALLSAVSAGRTSSGADR